MKGHRAYTIDTYKPIVAFFFILPNEVYFIDFKSFVCGVLVCVQILMGTHVRGPVEVCGNVCVWTSGINLSGYSSADVHVAKVGFLTGNLVTAH